MSTQMYRVSVELHQTASFGRGQERAYLTRTAPVIPGATIRGALAAAWRREGWPSDASFAETFDGDVRFSPLVPRDMRLQPLSVYACKYHDVGAGHPAQTDLAFESGGFIPDDCGSRGERLKGGYLPSPGSRGIRTASSTRISRRTQTAQASNLFTREGHPPSTVFTGHIIGDPALVDRLCDVHDIVVGGRRSVMGGAGMTIERGAGPLSLPDSPRGEVVIRAISPTILVDAAGRPATALAPSLGEMGLRVDPRRVWDDRLTADGTGGWHAASGLPKPAELAIVAGATAVLLDPDPSRLQTLLEAGLGLRRAEGYGWFEVATAPAAPQAPRMEAHRSSGVMQEIRDLNLTPRQSSWLADQIRDTVFGASERAALLISRPAARDISLDQKTKIGALLVTMPDIIRTAVALRVEREAGQ